MLIMKGYNRLVKLLGIHHVAAVTAGPDECRDFYSRVLGLRPVGGPDVLAFAGGAGEGGGVLAFLTAPGVPSGSPGRGLVHTLRWRASGDRGLDRCQARLETAGYRVEEVGEGRGIRFLDPDGLCHEVLRGLGRERPRPAGQAPLLERIAGVRAHAHASVAGADLLAGRLGFAVAGPGAWQIGEGDDAAEYRCEAAPAGRPSQGAGTISHVAWACRAGEEPAWRQRVIGMG